MDRPLFDTTPYQYRKRWDLIVETVGFQKALHFDARGAERRGCGLPLQNGEAHTRPSLASTS